MPNQRIPHICGLDFGTSNSTIGLIENGKPELVRVEAEKTTIPSAVFFNFEDGLTYFGRMAIEEYVDGAEGRLMRALKNVLGTSLMNETTPIKNRHVAFATILGTFIAHLKNKAETEAGEAITQAVIGRPVHFIDDNAEADREAQNQLEFAAREQGFRQIEFQYEPIAAALDYEQQVVREQLALIIDIGGGTADFSIVRVSPERSKVSDRREDILANAGVHIGGTDFDRLLSMSKVMPHFGYGSPKSNGKQDVPSAYYYDLSTWQLINRLYDRKTLIDLRYVRQEATFPELIDNLIEVVEHRQGHHLAGQVEKSKIDLSAQNETGIELKLRSRHIQIPLSRREFNEAILPAVNRITQTVQETLQMAGVRRDDIQALFLTGGSTQIPIVKKSILAHFPKALIVEGDMFGSVGLGLTIDASRKFV